MNSYLTIRSNVYFLSPCPSRVLLLYSYPICLLVLPLLEAFLWPQSAFLKSFDARRRFCLLCFLTRFFLRLHIFYSLDPTFISTARKEAAGLGNSRQKNKVNLGAIFVVYNVQKKAFLSRSSTTDVINLNDQLSWIKPHFLKCKLSNGTRV